MKIFEVMGVFVGEAIASNKKAEASKYSSSSWIWPSMAMASVYPETICAMLVK